MKPSSLFTPCLIMPCYEKHATLLAETIKKYLHLNIPIIVIDDGSSDLYCDIIKKVTQELQCDLIRKNENGGKGSAIKVGLKAALEKGFTHAVQVDSDGQHSSLQIEELIALAKLNPLATISGQPIYDQTISKGRYYGRYLTHIWVWIHTLSFKIQDSMCGYRVYPLLSTNAILSKYKVGDKMDFDIEILVYHMWENSEILFLDVPVTYPVNNVSYFKAFDDNVLISKMHATLFFKMIPRSPKIIYNRFFKKKENKWHRQDEKGAYFLMSLTLTLFKILGDIPVRFVGFFIAFYYSLVSSEAKKYSEQYKTIYQSYCHKHQITPIVFSYRQHVQVFTNMVIDKLCVWSKRIKRENINASDLENYYRILNQRKGTFFISSHYGNIEIIRSIGQTTTDFKINTLMYTHNSQKIFSIINKISKDANMGIIDISNISPGLAISLQDKLDANELIFCMGDRLTVKSDKSLSVGLLDEKALLPYGPFLLVHLLNYPTYSIHCYKENKQYRIALKEISINKNLNKHENIQNMAQEYANEVQRLILQSPTQWFNFSKTWI